MNILTSQVAVQKRDELVELGYTLIPNLLKDPLLGELQDWSQALFDKVPVESKYRYQGSDIHVYTERLWETMDAVADYYMLLGLIRRGNVEHWCWPGTEFFLWRRHLLGGRRKFPL